MRKVLVVFTGGTIGSKTRGTEINVQEGAGFELLDKYLKTERKEDEISFKAIQPFTRLSENFIPSDWEVLYQSIMKHDLSEYSGIIITHGSDTLAYSAAAVSYMFHDTDIPILLTASNYPLDHPKSEAVRNFASCVAMIEHDPLPGVFVIFEDDKGLSLVHLASRLMQSKPFTDQFYSIYDTPFGEIQGGRLQVFANDINPTLDELRHDRSQIAHKLAKPTFTPDILLLKPYPGFQYTFVIQEHKDKRPRAILIELYHSGTTGLRSVTEEDALAPFASWCQDNGIDLYAAPMKSVSGSLYASYHDMLALGITPLAGISLEAALVKLMLAYGVLKEKRDIEQFVKRNLFYEFVLTM